jgi:hypothetical protein
LTGGLLGYIYLRSRPRHDVTLPDQPLQFDLLQESPKDREKP